MSYSVVQTKMESPSVGQMVNAFRQVPGLTALDINTLGRDAYGLLVKGFEEEQALAMQSALAAEGLETEVVDEAVLPELPPPKQLIKVDFTPEALVIYDILERTLQLPW